MPAPHHQLGMWYVTFNNKTIKTKVTNKGDDFASWIKGVQYYDQHCQNLVVCLDIENYFTQPKGGKQRCALLQLCVGTRGLVFQIYRKDYIPDELVNFLNDDRNSFFGVGIADDVKLLKEDYELDVTCYMDLRNLASSKLNLNGNSGSLKSLVKDVLGVDLERPSWIHYHYSWNAAKLNKTVIEYASRNAATSFYIGLNLRKIKTN